MNKYTIGVAILLVVVGGGYLFTRGQKQSTEDRGGMPVVQSHRSYDMELTSREDSIEPLQSTKITYKIKNERGETLKNFEIAHEKVMHFIVVRHDLQDFQHLHPDYDKSTGEFVVEVTFPNNGPYRLFPDFTPAEDNPQKLPVTVFSDIEVGDQTKYKAIPVTVDTKTVKTYGDYPVTFTVPSVKAQKEFDFSLMIERNGQPVTDLEKYLGALGHSVIVKATTLDFIHTHALDGEETGSNTRGHNMQEENDSGQGPTINFSTMFPEPGIYKIFTQFQHQGQVKTVDYTIQTS